MLTITDLFDLDHTIAKDYLAQFTYPWEALAGIKDFILSVGPTLEGYDRSVIGAAPWWGPAAWWATPWS